MLMLALGCDGVKGGSRELTPALSSYHDATVAHCLAPAYRGASPAAAPCSCWNSVRLTLPTIVKGNCDDEPR